MSLGVCSDCGAITDLSHGPKHHPSCWRFRPRPGKLDARVLDQDAYWYDIEGNQYVIAEMNQHHRASLIPFLERRAPRLHEASMWGSILSSSGPGPSGSDADWFDVEHFGDSLEWLRRKPLYRKLAEYEVERTSVDRLKTKIRNKTHRLRRRS